MKEFEVSGLMINYYLICKRKLWYYLHNLEFEKYNENVKLGKLIDNNSYKRNKKNILIGGSFNIDFIDNGIVHEVKKSDKMESSDKWQLKFYMYKLREKGVYIKSGLIDYPKLRKREEVFLISNDIEFIKEMEIEIKEIVQSNYIPEKINSKICKKCAYYEFCYI